MKMLLTAGVVAIAMAFGASAAQAGHSHHERGYYHGYHHGHHGDYGDALLIGVGIVAGALLLNRLLTPRRYPPAPVYIAPPPPRRCVQDRVYRYLPNGNIQWGTRTTCYH